MSEMEPVLSLTRAWTLVRFFDGGMLQTTSCTQCGGHFVVHAHDLHSRYAGCAIRPLAPENQSAKPAASPGGSGLINPSIDLSQVLPGFRRPGEIL